LRELCEQGLRERYGDPTPEQRARLAYELGIIAKMGYASYFLIVWDFIKYAREQGIPVGPGRGSAAGSIVAYALRISDVDPLRYNLFFERFLNPDRISMPDIDTDFCFERRDEVIEYVTRKYGEDRVAQIVTFGTMAARAAVRDVGRVMGVPLPDVDRIAKLIPNIPTNPMSIQQAIDTVPELTSLYQRDAQARTLLDTAKRVEGLARHASTHAAGVVIAPGPITDYAPLVRLGDGDINTQYSMEWVERVGLLKMDFLGLRTLTVLEAAATEIRRTSDPHFTIESIPLDDAKTYALLSAGQTTGVFQLESAGMRRYIVELKPNRIEDVIAMVALYRPGPMDWINDFIAGKHGRRAITYLHPKLQPILEETYGIACLKHDTPVHLADGSLRAIKDIRAGDEILTWRNGVVEPGRVAKVWPSGVKRTLRITLSTGTTIECSEDHRFPTPGGDVEARDLTSRGSEVFSYGYTDSKSMLFEQWKIPQSLPDGIGELKAYLLGLYIGDGYLGSKSVPPICTATKRNAMLIGELLQRAFECRTHLYFNTRAWYVYPVFLGPRTSKLRQWLDLIYGSRAWKARARSKSLPANCVSWPEEDRVALLRGLWDSDGSYGDGGPLFRSTSSRLVEQVADLLSTLKISFYVRKTAVFVRDRSRFTKLLKGPLLPDKVYTTARASNALPVQTAAVWERLGAAVAATDRTARKCLTHASTSELMKIVPGSLYPTRIIGFWDAYNAVYRDMYLQDTRPVCIDSIEPIGDHDCFDIQMEDQTNPYFVANGIVTHNCYQEQVMQMCRDLASYTAGQADEMRKVIGKKIKEKIPVERDKFIKGCMRNGIDEQLATKIWQFIEPFAGYGFNKAHSVCYGLLAYQTAWLKANYPLAFMAALLTSVKQNTDKLVEYLADCTQRKLRILPPDVNESGKDFTVVGDAIRFGLAAVKNVGEGAVQEIIARRAAGPFASLADICARVDCRIVNRRVLESLIKAGALDGLPGNRSEQLAGLDAALDYGQHGAQARAAGQTSLFSSDESGGLPPPGLPRRDPPSGAVLLAQEKEAIGVYISGHPLSDKADELGRRTTHAIAMLRQLPEDEMVTIGGVITASRRVVTKAGGQMLVAKLEDLTGTVEVVVFPKWFPDLSPMLLDEAIVVIKGRVKERRVVGKPPGYIEPQSADEEKQERPEVSLQALEAWPFNQARYLNAQSRSQTADRDRPPAQALHIRLLGDPTDAQRLQALRDLLRNAQSGDDRVYLHAGSGGESRPLRQPVSLTPSLREDFRSLFGADNVWLADTA
ncbi:MAG: DNA polymerase III subunit alpha, partial [Candidatus Eremiobacteraeota bacterium]|nr:DNA polymerase III subunit alpha [Candidatus Eremiobacteraeota bacterium]